MVRILFSAEFIPAAALLLLMLPGDLFRISAETIGLPLLVQKRLVIYTGLYRLWAALYLALAVWLMPQMGLSGVAFAYLTAQAIYATVLFCLVHRLLGYNMSSKCIQSLMSGLALVSSVAFVVWYQDRWTGYAICIALLAL